MTDLQLAYGRGEEVDEAIRTQQKGPAIARQPLFSEP
jgi:hypothetical protein